MISDSVDLVSLGLKFCEMTLQKHHILKDLNDRLLQVNGMLVEVEKCGELRELGLELWMASEVRQTEDF